MAPCGVLKRDSEPWNYPLVTPIPEGGKHPKNFGLLYRPGN